ncbi:hypothetical protein FCL47_12230 [Desulfopila sp. IMCC35006]|uniref:hypothetical protein n=1 Tax=Desulfopila sp. IMCC35006 TaxID=2569542 RepID=UPI0010AC3FCE|nr:hypothetical protein [Desulfopila sp. IMCC35006]TKB25857.1 hypothetical protein FCL47_12230 [Desulfopila sp. IMCC35006]
MNERKDLTRWNRAGLNRFDYIDGNAVEYLEYLRQKLVRHFADPTTGLCKWINPPQNIPPREVEVDGENLVQRQQRLRLRNQRLLETYLQDRRDWAWEISRTFARCCHMLTEHANAYANEGFLGTATQWDNVRCLVEMLDYHPAPPASAYTWLSLTAKEGKSGVIPRGFQVKNSPPAGSDKVIFETLEDVFIDAELNELRPKGWNKSEQPLHQPANSGEITAVSSTLLAEVMEDPAIELQGIGTVQAGKLDSLAEGDGFKIKDFLTLDPNSTGLDINTTSLSEWKAKADFLHRLAPPGDWSVIADALLPEIAAKSAESLAEQSGNTLEMAAALKQAIGMVEVCLDHQRFVTLQYKQLVIGRPSAGSSVKISWYVPTKPAVEPGEMAMVMDSGHDRAEAVTISRVEPVDGEPPLLELEFRTSPLQNSWGQWAKGNTLLHYSSRWHKKPWLSGADVIRTKEAHGLTAEAYIGWKDGDDNWQYTKVIESDRMNLRLEQGVTPPEIGTVLYQLTPVEGRRVAANLDVVVVLDADSGDMAGEEAVEDVSMAVPGTDDIFTLIDIPEFSDSALSVSLPGGLPGIGSFLFPSPFLPVDLVKAAVELMLSLGLMQIPSTGEFVIKGFPPSIDGLNPAEPTLSALAAALYDFLDGLEVNGTKIVHWEDSPPECEAKLLTLLGNAAIGDTPLFQQIKMGLEQKGPMLAISKQADRIAEVIAPDPLYMFDSTPDRIQEGDWVVAEFDKGLAAVKISEIEKFIDADKTASFGLRFDALPSQPGELKRVHADFRGELQPYEATINLSPIDSENFELEQVPANLKIGRSILVTGCGEPYLVTITAIHGGRITCKPSLTSCLAGRMVLNGNVVVAGHGEAQPEKILGSGDASKNNQMFTLEIAGISFTSDATKSAGVAAAIEVVVAGRVWEQVSSLKDSAADEQHYEIRMTDDGYVKIIFGDGSNGRRLPNGKNNIRVRYRVGSGVVGNVSAGSLHKAIKPNPLVDHVVQYLPAGGGGDMEDQTSLRSNAPPTLLALKRAVSLKDFSHLAGAQSSMWQARAFNEILQGGRLQQVTVIVVPAGGVLIPDLQTDLQTYLQKHSMPGVRVVVEFYQPQIVDLQVTLRVDSAAFIPQEIAAAVEVELIRHFSLQKRGLGQPLYLSEVYRVVEGIEGVENSVCALNDHVRVVRAEDRNRVVYLDTAAGSSLTILPEEYRP